MVRIFILILFGFSFLDARCQSLSQRADSLLREYYFYHWEGKNKIYLTSYGTLERQFPRVIFQGVEFSKDSGLYIINGFVNMTGDREDTISLMGGLDIMVAHRVGSHLSNIYRYGTTMAVSSDQAPSLQEGSFTLRLKLKPTDFLLIGNAGDHYWGGVIIHVGKLTSRLPGAQHRLAKSLVAFNCKVY